MRTWDFSAYSVQGEWKNRAWVKAREVLRPGWRGGSAEVREVLTSGGHVEEPHCNSWGPLVQRLRDGGWLKRIGEKRDEHGDVIIYHGRRINIYERTEKP